MSRLLVVALLGLGLLTGCDAQPSTPTAVQGRSPILQPAVRAATATPGPSGTATPTSPSSPTWYPSATPLPSATPRVYPTAVQAPPQPPPCGLVWSPVPAPNLG